jgi:hypothetical protein
MKLVGTEIMDRLVPILNGAAVGGGQCRLQVDLLRTLCAMAETDDYEEILRLQGAARYIADDEKNFYGTMPGE